MTIHLLRDTSKNEDFQISPTTLVLDAILANAPSRTSPILTAYGSGYAISEKATAVRLALQNKS